MKQLGVLRLRAEPLKSTVLLGAHVGGELLAFTTSIGAPLAGGGDEHLICTASETSMRVAACLVDDRMVVRQIWYDIPRVAPARFQRKLPCGRQKDYTVTVEDVRQILTSTMLRFHVGGDRPMFQARLNFAEEGKIAAENIFDRGVFKLPIPVEIGRVERFWVELSWPSCRLGFGKLCEDSDLTARIPIAFYLVA